MDIWTCQESLNTAKVDIMETPDNSSMDLQDPVKAESPETLIDPQHLGKVAFQGNSMGLQHRAKAEEDQNSEGHQVAMMVKVQTKDTVRLCQMINMGITDMAGNHQVLLLVVMDRRGLRGNSRVMVDHFLLSPHANTRMILHDL
jgi:hypothetical protein